MKNNKRDLIDMPKRKTHEEFVKEVFDLVGNEYTILGDYINTYTKIKMRHNKCNTEYRMRPDDFLSGCRCPHCAGKMKKTTEEFKQEVFDLVGEEYTVLGDYINSYTKIEMRHNKCGTEYEVTPNKLLSGCRCPHCFRAYKKTTEEFKQEVFDLVGEEYTVLGEYINANTKILIRHNKCGTEYEVTPNKLLSGCRCPHCFGKIKKVTEQFRQEVFNLVGEEYTVLGDYINSYTKIEICHNKCGTEYRVAPSDFLRGCRCPKCNKSHGEIFIDNFLTNKNVIFKSQYKIPDCKNINPLPFDFAIIADDDKLLGLIEYDGEQHFKPIEYFGGKEGLKLYQKRDQIKTDYCKANNIPLLRIPYTYKEKEIKDTVNRFLKEVIHQA